MQLLDVTFYKCHYSNKNDLSTKIDVDYTKLARMVETTNRGSKKFIIISFSCLGPYPKVSAWRQ